MAAAGIVQRGDPALTVPAQPFNLPAEADHAAAVINQLTAAAARVREHHVFAKGLGLAAPQIGIPRAAAIIYSSGSGTHPLVFLNPQIAAEYEEDEQYEGCLSFFDYRGLVPRPLFLEITNTRLDGSTETVLASHSSARLAAHELDHLNGALYTDRMRPGVSLVHVDDYHGTGSTWTYK